MSDHKQLVKEFKQCRRQGERARKRSVEIILELKRELSYRQVGNLLGMKGQAVDYFVRRYGKE